MGRAGRPGPTVTAVFGASELSPRTRRLASALIHKAWHWVGAVGATSPEDAGRHRFAALGEGSLIAFPPGDVFGEGRVAIGAHTLVAPFVSLAVGMPGEPMEDDSPIITIGDRCLIGRGSSIIARCRVDIGDDVTVAPNVYITDHNHTYGNVEMPIGRQWPAADAVRIGDGSWLGSGVIVLPGASIGTHVTVAAGSIVRGDVPDYSVVAGVPARLVRRYTPEAGWVPPMRDLVLEPPEGWPVN
jgi:acetyltransferase-like isoleucine patch superfamily enzyme